MPKPSFSKPVGPKRREPMTAADVQHNRRMQRDVQLEWAEACERSSDRLTTWECDFIESILGQLRAWGERREGTLSERQVEVLEKIYQKV